MEEIRYLTDDEKSYTRPLWEKIFPEDSKAFLDYYYSVKTQDNEILVLEKDGAVRSMLQLNPYRLKLGESQADCAYVIAVATEEDYRHQGMMRRLLEQAMRDRYQRKQPFLFLIPAEETIYRPFGFRYVSRQEARSVAQMERSGMPDVAAAEIDLREKYTLIPVQFGEEAEAAVFAEQFLERTMDVYSVRNAEYYRILRKEVRSEDGELSWVMKGEERIGLLSYTMGEATEVREPMVDERYRDKMDEILLACFEEQERSLYVFGLLPENGNEKKPMIMIRPLYLPALFSGIRAEEELEFVIRVHDKHIAENNDVFVWHVGTENSSFGKEWMPCRQGLDLDVSVEALSQLLFGWQDIDEICRTEHCSMTPTGRRKWKKLHTPHRVFINEVV